MKRIFISDGKNIEVKHYTRIYTKKKQQSKNYKDLKKRKALLDEEYESNSRWVAHY